MDEQEGEHIASVESGDKKGQPGQSTRYVGTTQYEIYSGSLGGHPRIFFKFEPPEGQTQLEPAVYAAICDHKKTKGTGHPTGLQFKSNGPHARTWSFPNNQLGRIMAKSLDSELQALSREMTNAEGRSP